MAETKEKICGMEINKIRKMFFTGKLQKMLLEIQSLGDHSPEEYRKLNDYLTILKRDDEKLNSTFSKFLPTVAEDEEDTVLDELSRESLSEAEIAELSKEEGKRKTAVQGANFMLRDLFSRFHDKDKQSPSEDELMNMAFELLSLQYFLRRDEIYKERLFRRRIVEFERAGKQRKTAEEYAKTETVYREYKLAEGLKDDVNEFINLAKKRYGAL